MRVALDTNILAYAEGVEDAPKCTSAVNLIRQLQAGEVILPAQTLGELFRVLTGKQKISCTDAEQAIFWSAIMFEFAAGNGRLYRRTGVMAATSAA